MLYRRLAERAAWTLRPSSHARGPHCHLGRPCWRLALHRCLHAAVVLGHLQASKTERRAGMEEHMCASCHKVPVQSCTARRFHSGRLRVRSASACSPQCLPRPATSGSRASQADYQSSSTAR